MAIPGRITQIRTSNTPPETPTGFKCQISSTRTFELPSSAIIEAASETCWNWLEPNTASKTTHKTNASRTLKFVTTTGEGSAVLGTVELKSRTIELGVNSEIRANRGRKMLETLLDGLASAPLVERQTLGRRLISSQPDTNGGELDHRHVICGELVVARGDTAEVFDLVEEALHEVARLVEVGAEVDRVLAV